jgi:hypothetical protein
MALEQVQTVSKGSAAAVASQTVSFTSTPTKGRRKAQRSKVNDAFLTASGFSVFALIVFAVLLKPVVNEVQDAFRVDFAFSDYSALDVMFVFLTLVWLLIAVGFAVQAARLVKTRRKYQ